MAFADSGGGAVRVGADAPLPTTPVLTAAYAVPVAGTLSASAIVGPFMPQLGRTIWLTLAGSWTGTARLLRSTDGGATRLPLTIAGQSWASFTGNANEPVGEESVAGASYWLEAMLASGMLDYRVQQ